MIREQGYADAGSTETEHRAIDGRRDCGNGPLRDPGSHLAVRQHAEYDDEFITADAPPSLGPQGFQRRAATSFRT